MSRIYDYNQFSSKKNRIGGDFTFGQEMRYVDIDLFDRPEEWADLDDCKAFIEYSIDINVKKSGIEGLTFRINSVELEFTVDDYPNSSKEFDFDLIPGKTIDYSQLNENPLDYVIPSYPSNLEINMNKSQEPSKWKIKVNFGTDVNS
jgi:hypothetical protein